MHGELLRDILRLYIYIHFGRKRGEGKNLAAPKHLLNH